MEQTNITASMVTQEEVQGCTDDDTSCIQSVVVKEDDETRSLPDPTEVPSAQKLSFVDAEGKPVQYEIVSVSEVPPQALSYITDHPGTVVLETLQVNSQNETVQVLKQPTGIQAGSQGQISEQSIRIVNCTQQVGLAGSVVVTDPSAINASPVVFNIPASSSSSQRVYQTISPKTPLPHISEKVYEKPVTILDFGLLNTSTSLSQTRTVVKAERDTSGDSGDGTNEMAEIIALDEVGVSAIS